MQSSPRLKLWGDTLMYMITAVVRASQLSRVRAQLLHAGVHGMTVSQCSGHGRNPRMVPGLKDGPDVGYLEENVQIEVAVSPLARDVALDAIAQGARSCAEGGGKIFVASLERVLSIRTGLEDDLALEAPAEMWVEAAE